MSTLYLVIYLSLMFTVAVSIARDLHRIADALEREGIEGPQP